MRSFGLTLVFGHEYWLYPTYSDDYPLALTLDESRLSPRPQRAINKQ